MKPSDIIRAAIRTGVLLARHENINDADARFVAAFNRQSAAKIVVGPDVAHLYYITQENPLKIFDSFRLTSEADPT